MFVCLFGSFVCSKIVCLFVWSSIQRSFICCSQTKSNLPAFNWTSFELEEAETFSVDSWAVSHVTDPRLFVAVQLPVRLPDPTGGCNPHPLNYDLLSIEPRTNRLNGRPTGCRSGHPTAGNFVIIFNFEECRILHAMLGLDVCPRVDNQNSGENLQDSTLPLSGKIAISQFSNHGYWSVFLVAGCQFHTNQFGIGKRHWNPGFLFSGSWISACVFFINPRTLPLETTQYSLNTEVSLNTSYAR